MAGESRIELVEKYERYFPGQTYVLSLMEGSGYIVGFKKIAIGYIPGFQLSRILVKPRLPLLKSG